METLDNFSFNRHSEKRIHQRGFYPELLTDAIDFGQLVQKQGLLFYIVLNSKLPKWLPPAKKERLRNAVVVVSSITNEIITCYKARKAYRNIRKKSKRLQ